MKNKYKNKFYWNEETLEHFRFNSSYVNKKEIEKEVTKFVENECDLEENETEEMLIKDLLNQINNTTIEEIETLKNKL
tara:strand:+ start:441 stop:674 length:234 start_codon:yes stop_codon:yes gene_type:complete